MKRIVCMVVALLICLCAAGPAFAAEGFVPSISYKDHPEVTFPVSLVDKEGKEVEKVEEGCLVVTSIGKVDESKEIPEDAKKELKDVYKKLSDGSMTLPTDGGSDLVIRDLFDVSLICTDGHKEELAKEGVYLEVTFDLQVAAGTEVTVMVYLDGQWVSVPKVTNNGDGTVTVLFEDICPVAFAVSEASHNPPAQTGDNSNIVLWSGIMAVAAGALVCMLVFRRKLVK